MNIIFELEVAGSSDLIISVLSIDEKVIASIILAGVCCLHL